MSGICNACGENRDVFCDECGEYDLVGTMKADLQAALATVERLKAALELYADPEQWRGFFWPIHEDRGLCARTTLAAATAPAGPAGSDREDAR